MPPQSDDLRNRTLREHLHLGKRLVWLAAAVVVVCTVTALLVSSSRVRLYEASARLAFQPPMDVNNPSESSAVDSSTLELQLQSVIDSMDSPKVRRHAAARIGDEARSPDVDVKAGLFVPEDTSGESSNLVEITATTRSPAVAARAANAYAAAIIAVRREAQRRRYRAAQRVLERQLKLFTTPASQASTEYIMLLQQLRNLQISEAAATGDFEVIVPATRPDAPVSPKPLRTAALGFGVGIVAGLGLAFIVSKFDTRVRSDREAAKVLGLPVLGRVPRISRQALGENPLVVISQPDGNVSEALRMLRSNLEWAGIDHNFSSLLVTSSVKGEGKTLTACNLAVSMARAGHRVVIVDADLRDPQVHRVFRISNSVGLTSVVRGKTDLTNALQSFEPSAPAAALDGRLRVLPSGPLPPDPGEIAASRRLAAIVKDVTALDADFVVIDAPPLLSVGDAASLATSVTALLMVVNIDKARRPDMIRSHDLLQTMPSRKLGAVIVGERVNREEYYQYGKPRK